MIKSNCSIEKALEELYQDWIQELQLQRLYSVHTVLCYGKDVQNFLEFVHRHLDSIPSIELLNSLTTADFRSWLSHRISLGISARSNGRALSSLRSFFRFLQQRHVIDNDSIDSIHRPKLPHTLPKSVSEIDVLKFLEIPYFFSSDPQWITNRDRALYTLLYCTGMRISEALNLQTKDISEELLIRGKGKKERIVILLPIALNRIKTYVDSCPHDLRNGYLFVGLKGKKLHTQTIDARLRKLRTQYLSYTTEHGQPFCLPDNMSSHSFRHSFATHLVQDGVDLRSVQELLGHESLASTQVYVDVDDQKMLQVFHTCSPLEKKS